MTNERYPLILVPGAMASELYLGDDQIWPPDEWADTTKLRHLKGDALTVGGLVRAVRPIPQISLGWIDIYRSFVEDFLVKELGYVEGEDLFLFPYDWRRDIRIAARKLRSAIEEFSQIHRENRSLKQHEKVKFYLIGESMGSLVCRWFIDQEGGQHFVSHMALLGPVDRGMPASFVALSTGYLMRPLGSEPITHFLVQHLMPRVLGGMTDIMRSMDAFYQFLPSTPFVYGPNGPIDIFEDASWLRGGGGDELQQWLSYLKTGKQVQEMMTRPACVPTTYIYGLSDNFPTPQSIHVNPCEGGGYDWAHARIDWGRGDGIVLSRSAWPGDLDAGIEVIWTEDIHSRLHDTQEVRDFLRNKTLKPQHLADITKPIGLSEEEIKEYLHAIVNDDGCLAASKADSGRQVILLPADPERPTQDVRAVIASAQPGKPIIIQGRNGAGKREALYSVMWHIARSGLEGDQGLLMPIYLDLRRYRGGDDLISLLCASVAEIGVCTLLTEQVEALLENVPSLIFFDELESLLERHRQEGISCLNKLLETYPKIRAVFTVTSGSYSNDFRNASTYMLLSSRLETATNALPQQVGDVIVAVIGNNASNIAIGRQSSAKSVEVAADAIVKMQKASGQKTETDYEQLHQLVTAAREQEWDKVESIAEAIAGQLAGLHS